VAQNGSADVVPTGCIVCGEVVEDERGNNPERAVAEPEHGIFATASSAEVRVDVPYSRRPYTARRAVCRCQTRELTLPSDDVTCTRRHPQVNACAYSLSTGDSRTNRSGGSFGGLC
jgi:hypothetical protein